MFRRCRRPFFLAMLVALGAAFLLGVTSAAEGDAPSPIYLDSSYSFGERAADLVARLTPAQRASQLVSSQAPAITNATNPLLTGFFENSQTTLAAPASGGDTNVKVASVTGISVGTRLTIGPDGPQETVTVSSVGTAQLAATTLAAAAGAGDTVVKVASVTNMNAGHLLRLDAGTNVEFATIQSIGTAGAAGTGVTLTAQLTKAHASGVAAQDLGTGVTFTPALSSGHAFGAAVAVLIQGIPRYGWWNEALHGPSRESTAAAGNAVQLNNT